MKTYPFLRSVGKYTKIRVAFTASIWPTHSRSFRQTHSCLEETRSLIVTIYRTIFRVRRKQGFVLDPVPRERHANSSQKHRSLERLFSHFTLHNTLPSRFSALSRSRSNCYYSLLSLLFASLPSTNHQFTRNRIQRFEYEKLPENATSIFRYAKSLFSSVSVCFEHSSIATLLRVCAISFRLVIH